MATNSQNSILKRYREFQRRRRLRALARQKQAQQAAVSAEPAVETESKAKILGTEVRKINRAKPSALIAEGQTLAVDKIEIAENGNRIIRAEFQEPCITEGHQAGDFIDLVENDYKIPEIIKEGDIIQVAGSEIKILEKDTEIKKEEIVNLQNKLFG